MQGTPHHLGSYPGPLPALAGTPTAEGVASAEAQAAAAAALASQYASTYAAADESDIAHSSKWQLLFQTQSEMASRLAEMATAMRRQLSLAQSHTLGLSPNSSVGQDSSKQNQITPFYHNPHNLLSHERRTSLTTTTTSITTPSVVPFGASVPASRLLSKQTHSNQHQNRKNNLASQQTTPQERFNCPHVSCDKTYATKRGLHDHLKKGASAHSSATPSTSHALAAIATDPVVDSEHEQPPHFTPTTTLPQRTPHHYACPDPFCGRSWQTSKTLLKHLKDFPSHSTQVALAPPVRAAAIESGRKTSVVARTVLSSAGDKPVSFVCPGCDKEFLGASNLKRHLGRFPRHDIDHEDEEEEEDKDGEYGAAEDELEGKQARGQEVEELVAEAPSELEEDPQVELADVREEQEIQLVEGMLVEEEGELEGAQQLKEQAVKEHEYELGEKVHVATLSRGLDVEVEEGELVEDVEHSVAEGEEEDKSNEAEVESQAVIGVEVTAAIMEGEESVTPVDETSGMAVHSRTNAPQELATLDPKTVTLADQQLNTVTDATAISIDSDHAIHEPEVEPKAASKVKVVQNEAPSVHQQASVSAEQEPGVSVALVQQEGATAKDVQPGPGKIPLPSETVISS
ncbi:hypothetical protein BC830DRAFT_855532 [Chytriomyces sp. MP71]|nr:hypothetical protein BC830DRAFT_855532 [Chytriomyces sp. MP71]